MDGDQARHRLGDRPAAARGPASRFCRVLVLTGVLGWVLAACGIQDPSPSPSPTSPPRIQHPSPPPSPASARPSSVRVRVVDRILVPEAIHLVVDPRAHAIYVGDEEGTLSVVETSTHRIVKRLRLGHEAAALALDAGARRLYVLLEESGGVNTVLVIDTRSLEAVDTITIGQGGSPDELAVDPPTGRLFVVHDDGLSVVDIDSHKVVRSVSIQEGAPRVAVDSEVGVVFVTGERQLLAIDTKTLDVLDAVEIDGGSGPITTDSATGRAFISHEADGIVTAVDTTTRKVVKTIAVGGPYGPFSVTIDPSARVGYVTGGRGGAVGVFDTKTLEVVKEILRPDDVHWGVWPLAVDPSTGLLYITSDEGVLVVARY